VRLFHRIYSWLFRKKHPPELGDAASRPAIARDLGVKVTRVQMPSGGEIVVVEKVRDEEDG
jgi:hypothetical protein